MMTRAVAHEHRIAACVVDRWSQTWSRLRIFLSTYFWSRDTESLVSNAGTLFL